MNNFIFYCRRISIHNTPVPKASPIKRGKKDTRSALSSHFAAKPFERLFAPVIQSVCFLYPFDELRPQQLDCQ